MGYTDVDKLAINTIRVLAVSPAKAAKPLCFTPRPRHDALPRHRSFARNEARNKQID